MGNALSHINNDRYNNTVQLSSLGLKTIKEILKDTNVYIDMTIQTTLLIILWLVPISGWSLLAYASFIKDPETKPVIKKIAKKIFIHGLIISLIIGILIVCNHELGWGIMQKQLF